MHPRSLVRGRRPFGALYAVDWTAVAVLLLVLFFSRQGTTPPQAPPGQAPGEGPADQTRAGPVVLVPRAPGQYLSGLWNRRVVVDPGHGGPDVGTRGVGPEPEKAVVLHVGLEMAELLRQAGARVQLTRWDDRLPAPADQNLSSRMQQARAFGGEVFVSLHADAHPDPQVAGVTAYYHRPDSYLLALALYEELVHTLQAPGRGVRRADFYVLRAAPMPAVLVELGYLTNGREALLLADPQYRSLAAAGLVEGLARYFASERRAPGVGTGRMGEDGSGPRADG